MSGAIPHAPYTTSWRAQTQLVSFILKINQLDAHNLFYNKFIS